MDILLQFTSAVSVVSLLIVLSDRWMFTQHDTSEPRCAECHQSIRELTALSRLMLGGLCLAALYRLQTFWLEGLVMFTWFGLSVFAAIQSIRATLQLLESKEA